MKRLSYFTLLLAFLCLAGINNVWSATSYSISGSGTNKTLTITGSGAMTDYASAGAPWYSERSNIKTIVINEGVTYIGAYAFQGITYSSITIPVSVTGFGARAFMGISSGTRNVYYAGTPNEWANIDFPLAAGGSLPSSHPFYSNNDSTNNHFFFYGKNTETVDLVFSEGLTTIKQFTFYKAGKITDVYIPGTVTSIEKQALNCNLTRIYINKSVAPITGTTAISWKTTNTYIYLRSDATNSYNKTPWINVTSGTSTGAKNLGYSDYSGTRVDCSWRTTGTYHYLHKVSGTINSINWTLDENGTLTLRGNGAIATTFTTSTGNTTLLPWYRFRRLVNKVVIEPNGGDITGINNAIQYCYMVKEITIKQTTIPTATFTPDYSFKVSSDKITVYIDNSSTGDAKLSSAPWNNSGLNIVYTTTFCSDPTALTISSIGSTSATASWTDDSGDTWRYICKPTADGEPTSSEWSSATSTNSKSVSVSALTAGTNYTFYLIADCGTMTSNVISEDFTTECDAISTLPWKYGFEDCTNNQTLLCWEELKPAGNTNGYVQATTVASKTGTFGLRIAGGRSTGSPKSEVIVVFPEFDEEISNLELSFFYKTDVSIIDPDWGNTIYGKLQLGYVTNPSNAASFVAFGEPLEQKSSFYPQTEGIVMEGAPTGARLAILYMGGENLGYAAIDDITIKVKPSCSKPTGVAVTADSETAEGATITWNGNGMSAWNVQVSKGDAASWVSTGSVATATKVLTGLDANSLYYVRVQADCGSGSTSDWSDAVSFTTLCGTINVSAASPWSIDFQGLSDHIVPDCWDNSASTTSSSWGAGYIWGTYSRFSNTMLAMDNSALSGGTALINTPLIAIPNDGNEYELTFDYANMAIVGNNLTVKIAANGGAFVEKGVYYPSGNVSSYPGAFSNAIISLADYSGQTIQVQFFANPTSGTSSEGGAMFVDNVSVHKVSSCIVPTGLAAGNLTANSVRITWTAGSSETAWRLQYRAEGGDWSAEQAVSGSAQRDLTGLSANTLYYVRVKAYCDAEDQSNWSDVLSFTTLCAAASMPFSEEFSSASELPSCWEATTTASYGWSAHEPTYGAYDIQLRTGSSGEATLRMPSISLSEAAILRFEWKNASGAQVNLYISTDGGTTKTMIPNDLSGVHADWTTKIFDLSAYTGETALIYFVANFSTVNQYAYLDDVEVIARPCDMILNIQAAPITGGATISWSGEVQKLQYKTGSDGWSPVAISSGDYSKTITGLTPARTYQVRLLPACSEEAEDNWTTPIFFVTSSTESVPYFNDFESETPGYVPFNWSRISSTNYPQVVYDSYAYGEFGEKGNSVKFYGVNDQILVLPEFDATLSALKISFHYRNRDCTMELGYVEDDGTTFVAIETLPNHTGYLEFPYEKDLYNISSDASKLAIRYSNAGSQAQAWVDNVSVELASCGQPRNLTFSDLTANSVHISWAASERGTESSYQYINKIWSESDPNWSSAITVSSSVTELNLTGLTPNKDYEFYLRSYCGTSDQSTPIKIEFKTLVAEEVFEDVETTNNEARLAALLNQTVNITINRPLPRNGDYSTICLPFDLTATDMADPDCPLHGFMIKEFDHSGNGEARVNIFLKQVTSIEAGKPYFIRYAGAPTNEALTPLRFLNVKVKASTPADGEGDDCMAQGIFNSHSLIANDQNTLFLSANNTLYYPTANGTMNGFRVYISVAEGSPMHNAIRNGLPIRVCENESTPTAVSNIENQEQQVESRKILRNGILVIERNGKEYNAQGILIK